MGPVADATSEADRMKKRKRQATWVCPVVGTEEPVEAPFYFNFAGQFVHHVRSVTSYTVHGKYSHTAIHFWCGNSGFLGARRNSRLYRRKPAGRPLCRRCFG